MHGQQNVKKTEDLVSATKKMGLEVYAEKTKHIRGQVSTSECRDKIKT